MSRIEYRISLGGFDLNVFSLIFEAGYYGLGETGSKNAKITNRGRKQQKIDLFLPKIIFEFVNLYHITLYTCLTFSIIVSEIEQF